MTDPTERRLLTPEEYREAQASPEFRELERRFRRFAFPMTVAPDVRLAAMTLFSVAITLASSRKTCAPLSPSVRMS